jgi:hypothetical protein
MALAVHAGWKRLPHVSIDYRVQRGLNSSVWTIGGATLPITQPGVCGVYRTQGLDGLHRMSAVGGLDRH